MGTAPVIAAMADVLRIPQAINKFLGTTDPRKKVDIGTSVEALIINILYGRTHWFMLLDISEDKTKTITDNGTIPNAESKYAMSIN